MSASPSRPGFTRRPPPEDGSGACLLATTDPDAPYASKESTRTYHDEQVPTCMGMGCLPRLLGFGSAQPTVKEDST